MTQLGTSGGDDEPVLRDTPGGWLATSPGDFPRIGVIADTPEEATALYRKERAEWRRLRALPDPETITTEGDPS